MQLKKEIKTITIKDPFQQFKEAQRINEIRYCPLTGRSTRVLGLSLKEFAPTDRTAMIEESAKTCPFCPQLIDALTPKFVPPLKEQYIVGNARCFPNAFPYDENNAVVTITSEHYVPVNGFTHIMLQEALECALLFLADIDPKKYPYQSINWNYMPVAGSSLVHPHLQIIASSTPSSYYVDILTNLEKNTNLFTDYLNTEKSLNERLIATLGDSTWLVAFAPMGQFDILGFFHQSTPLHTLTGKLNTLITYIRKTLQFLHSKKIDNFNMALYSIVHNNSFLPHIRICPRVTFPPYATSEVNYLQMLHNDSFTLLKPEIIAEEFKAFHFDL